MTSAKTEWIGVMRNRLWQMAKMIPPYTNGNSMIPAAATPLPTAATRGRTNRLYLMLDVPANPVPVI